MGVWQCVSVELSMGVFLLCPPFSSRVHPSLLDTIFLVALGQRLAFDDEPERLARADRQGRRRERVKPRTRRANVNHEALNSVLGVRNQSVTVLAQDHFYSDLLNSASLN